MSMTWGTKPIMENVGTIVDVVTNDLNTVQNPTMTIFATNTHGDVVQYQGGSAPFTENLFEGNGSHPTKLAYGGNLLFGMLNGTVDNFQIGKFLAGSWTSFAVSDGGMPKMLGGGPWLYMVYPGAVMRSNGQPGTWEPITPPVTPGNIPGNGTLFACNKNTIFAIAPDDSLFMFDGVGTTWTKIREQTTSRIFAGGEVLCAIDKSSGDILKFNGTAQSWTKIGGPGKMFAIGDGGEVYGLRPDGSNVVQWTGQPESCSVVGSTAAGQIYAGGGVLCATSPDNKALWCYREA